MEGKRSEYVTIPWPVVVISVLGFVAVMGWLLVPFGSSGGVSRTSALSNLKQLGTSIAIYESDYDDYLPPHFTFDSDKERDSFIAATEPYFKNRGILIDPKDKTPEKDLAFKPGMEGDPAVMSFVHSQALKQFIPHYFDGKRLLPFAAVEKTGEATLMRDPIRGYGEVKVGENQNAFWSPHRGTFVMLRFDTSARSKQPLDIKTDL